MNFTSVYYVSMIHANKRNPLQSCPWTNGSLYSHSTCCVRTR